MELTGLLARSSGGVLAYLRMMSFRVGLCLLFLIVTGCGLGRPAVPRNPVVFPPAQPIVPADPLRAQADGGDPVAQYNLALKLDGAGRHAEAARYFRLAALQNIPEAQFNFAILQADGLGVPKDEDAAFLMLKKAAVGRLAAAQYNVGVFLSEGRGTARSVEKALKWLRQAAVQGHGPARVYLAALMLRGEVRNLTGPQIAEAAGWINDEALKGDKQAQFYMALMTGRGIGVLPNSEEAYFWFELAAAQGVAPAARGRDLLAEKLTPAQVKQARDRAAQFRPLKPPTAPPRR